MKKKGSLLVVLAFLLGYSASAQTWIWYPGDYEIWLSNQMQNRRTDRGVFFPVFWKVDSHYNLMDFHKVYTLTAPETISIYVVDFWWQTISGAALLIGYLLFVARIEKKELEKIFLWQKT